MSIRKNGKIIAGNLSITTEDLTQQVSTVVNSKLDKLVNDKFNTIDTEIEDRLTGINTEVNDKLTTINTEVNDKLTTIDTEVNDKLKFITSIVGKINSEMIGLQKPWTGTTPPKNYIFMQGQEVSRTDYPLLYQYAVDNGLIIDDVEWQDYKRYGLYSYGDGETTFRVPNMIGYYLVGYDSEYHTGLATEQVDTLPDITGSLDLQGTNGSSLSTTSSADGVFKIVQKETENYPITGSTSLSSNLIDSIKFDLSNEYNTGDRVQPRSIPVNYIVCYKGSIEL